MHFRLVLLQALIACFGAAYAQSPTTLKTAVEKAVLQNPEVQLRFHNLEAVQQDRRSAQGAWFPRVDLEAAGGNYQQTTPSVPNSRGYNGNRASVQLRQTLFDGFITHNEVRRLSYSQQAAYFELMSISNQTALEVVRTYLDVLRYRDLVGLAESNYNTHLEVHNRIEQKVKAGVGRRVDLEQAAGRLALAESNWITEASNLHDVSARYQRLVGELPADTLAPAQTLDPMMPMGRDFLTAAVHKNPEFLGAVAGIRSARADSNVRRGAFSPTLELRARQSWETNQSGVVGDYRDSAVELVLNYNLFRGGSDYARVKQYVSKLESAFDLRDKVCRDVWQTGLIAYNDSVKLVSQIKLLSQHELSTSKAKQAYQQQFDIGQRSLLDLLDTENELYQARRSLAASEYDLQLAKARVLAISDSLLKALELQTLPATPITDAGGAEDDDELMRCNNIYATPATLTKVVPPVVVEAPPPAPAPVVVATPDPTAVACGELTGMFDAWLKAWNDKDLKSYLSNYSEKFVPALGLSRSKWEALRQKRVNKKGSIQATTTKVRPLRCDATSAELAFTQNYGSTDYKDEVDKTLSMERVGNAWKIVRETVTRGRTF